MIEHKRLFMTVVFALTAGPALASGFAYDERGAKPSGQEGAWVARADDAAAEGASADGVIGGTYTSSTLMAGLTAKYRF